MQCPLKNPLGQTDRQTLWKETFVASSLFWPHVVSHFEPWTSNSCYTLKRCIMKFFRRHFQILMQEVKKAESPALWGPRSKSHYCTGWSKSHEILSWHVLHLSRNKLQGNQKTKINVTLSAGSFRRVQRYIISLFSSCLMQQREEFLQWLLKCTAHYFDLLDTEKSGNVSMNSFWQVKRERDATWRSTMNTVCTSEKDILALRLFENKKPTGASMLKYHVTRMCSCIVTVIPCVY